MKRCGACGVNRPETAFYKRGDGSPGLRAEQLRRNYGIDPQDYMALLRAQRGLCAICEQPEPSHFGRLHVDHDHATGEVRGLLCSVCNIALGRFDAVEDWGAKAETYLRKPTACPGGNLRNRLAYLLP